MTAYVYFVKNGHNEVKIGVTTNIDTRLSELQTGNATALDIINTVSFATEHEAYAYERLLHEKYDKYRLNGEWFSYIPEFNAEDYIHPLTRKTKNTTYNTLYGEVQLTPYMHNLDQVPRCFFYPTQFAHSMTSNIKSYNLKIPFRTMKYPTNGNMMLLPFSRRLNRVFISMKKHDENRRLKKINKLQNSTLEQFFDV